MSRPPRRCRAPRMALRTASTNRVRNTGGDVSYVYAHALDMTVLPFMLRAWAFLFNNVYARDVHKRRLTLRIIRFRHLRPPLPQERATGSPYPSRRTIIRTGSVASLLEARSPTGPHFVYGNLTSESHPIAEAHLRRSTGPHVHLVGQRPAPRTSVPCALQMSLRLLGRHLTALRLVSAPPSSWGGFGAAAALRSGSCTSSRPGARTAHGAIACLVSALSSAEVVAGAVYRR